VTGRELLRNRGLLGLLARDTVSLTGSQMTILALPWFVLTTTGSASKMAFVVGVEAAALGIVGFAAGNVASRLGPRRTMLLCDAARAPLMVAIPVLHFLDLLSFPLLLAIVFAVGAFGTPSFASKAALIPAIVGEDEGAVSEANALIQIATRVSLVLGPPLAGVLIGVIGATSVLLVDAATFAVGFLLIGVFVRVGGAVQDTDESRGLGAGVRFLFRDRLLRPWSIAIIVGDVGWLAFFVSVPFLVLTRFGDEPQLVGWILGAFGAGAVVGNLVIFRIVRGIDRLLVASVGEVVMIAPVWLFVADVRPGLLVASMFTVGLANGVVNAPAWTIFTVRTPPALRAKAWAAIIATTSLLGPVVLLGTGPALESVGLTETLVAIFVAQSAAALLFMGAGLRERVRSSVSYEPVA
jgi:MFS family permease